MQEGPHRDVMLAAIERDGAAQRALLAGDAAAADGFAEAAELYRRSWELAPPRSYGRLIGMLKAAVLAGRGEEEAAAYARRQVPEPDSPSSWYARGIAAAIEDDDATLYGAAEGMDGGSDAFRRTATALRALAQRDADAYEVALGAILHDFEARDEHLTGVPIADTAAMLERLAARRGMATGAVSPLLPAAPAP